MANKDGRPCTNAAVLIEDRNAPGQYRVECEDEDGGVEVAVFSGPNALAP